MADIKLKNTTPGDGHIVVLSHVKRYSDGWTGEDDLGEVRHYPDGIWEKVPD